LGWSLDDRYIFAFGIEELHGWWFWDIVSGELIDKLDGGTVTGVTLDPSSMKYAFANITQTRIHDAVSYRLINRLVQPENTGLGFDILSVAWNPDGSQVATGSINGTVRVWDTNSGDILHTWQASDAEDTETSVSYVWGLAFSQDGTQLFSLRGDGTLRRWNIEEDKLIEEVTVADSLGRTSVSPYGGQIAFIPGANAAIHDMAGSRALSPDVAVQIVVPFPSFDRVRDIGAACIRDAADPAAAAGTLDLAALATEETALLPTFIARIEALPDARIPLACKLDLLAVARAIQ
jgi:hypothetical protein